MRVTRMRKTVSGAALELLEVWKQQLDMVANEEMVIGRVVRLVQFDRRHRCRGFRLVLEDWWA